MSKTRTERRIGFSEAQRITLLEEDADSFEKIAGGLNARLNALIVMVATAAVMLGINIALLTSGG